jgi:serine/threonine protein phosphatase PrpC
MAATGCPHCGEPVRPGDRFCEACGHDLDTPASAAPDRPRAAAARWLTATEIAAACPACQGRGFGADGFCEECGQRRPTARDHTELDLGVLAAVTDVGRRHHRNEDAVAIGVLGDAIAIVVCDGVSSSNRPDTASHAAADAAMAALLDGLADGAGRDASIVAATRAAQAAATVVAGSHPGPNPPSCTFVSAVATADGITVGWVGDSRAYWLPDGEGEPRLLTVDDSLRNALAAKGVSGQAIAENPQAASLVRWLGSDATDTDPHLCTIAPEAPGRLLVCSDGLFRYRPVLADLAATVAAAGGPPLAGAQSLTQLALDEGGQDNVTVVLAPYPIEALEPAAVTLEAVTAAAVTAVAANEIGPSRGSRR